MEQRGRVRPEVLQLWCWAPDGAAEESLTLQDATAVLEALGREAPGDRAPYPAWVSTAWHVLRWDEPSARVSWELTALALRATASVDEPLSCSELAAFVATRAALAASREHAIVEDEARTPRAALAAAAREPAVADEAPHAKRERRADAAARTAAQHVGFSAALFEDNGEDVVVSQKSGVVVVDEAGSSVLVERCRDCRIYVPCHVRCVRVVGCVDCLVYVGAARVASLLNCARCVLAAAAHRIIVDASTETQLRLFTPCAPLCVGAAPALGPLAAAYDGLARDAEDARLLPPAPNRWDALLALAPGAPRRRPLAFAPPPGAALRAAATILRPPGRGGGREAPPLPLPAAHAAALDAQAERADRARAALAGATRLGADRAAAVVAAARGGFASWLVRDGAELRDVVDLLRFPSRQAPSPSVA